PAAGVRAGRPRQGRGRRAGPLARERALGGVRHGGRRSSGRAAPEAGGLADRRGGREPRGAARGPHRDRSPRRPRRRTGGGGARAAPQWDVAARARALRGGLKRSEAGREGRVLPRVEKHAVAMKRDPLELAREVVRSEAQAVAALEGRLGPSFARAVETLAACRGKLVVAGVGKSGLVAQKIAATLTSTGSPAVVLHPADAL